MLLGHGQGKKLGIWLSCLAHLKYSAFLPPPKLPFLPVRANDYNAFAGASDAGPGVLAPIVHATLTSARALGQPSLAICGSAVTPMHRIL